MDILTFTPNSDPGNAQFCLAVTGELFSQYSEYIERLSELRYGKWVSIFTGQQDLLRVIYKHDLNALIHLAKVPFSEVCRTIKAQTDPLRRPHFGDFIKFTRLEAVVISESPLKLEKCEPQPCYTFMCDKDFDLNVNVNDLKHQRHFGVEYRQFLRTLCEGEQFYTDFPRCQSAKEISKCCSQYHDKLMRIVQKFTVFKMEKPNCLMYDERLRSLYMNFFENNGLLEEGMKHEDASDVVAEPSEGGFLRALQPPNIKASQAKSVQNSLGSQLGRYISNNGIEVTSGIVQEFLELYLFVHWHCDLFDVEKLSFLEFLSSFAYLQSNTKSIDDFAILLQRRSPAFGQEPVSASGTIGDTKEQVDDLPSYFFPLFNERVIPFHYELLLRSTFLLIKGVSLEAEYVHNTGYQTIDWKEKCELPEQEPQRRSQKVKFAASDEESSTCSSDESTNSTHDLQDDSLYLPAFIKGLDIRSARFEVLHKVHVCEETVDYKGSRDAVWADNLIKYIVETSIKYRDYQANEFILPLLAFLTERNVKTAFLQLFRFEQHLCSEKCLRDCWFMRIERKRDAFRFPYWTFLDIFERLEIKFELSKEEVDYFNMDLYEDSLVVREYYQMNLFMPYVKNIPFAEISNDIKIKFFEWLFYQISQSKKIEQYEKQVAEWLKDDETRMGTLNQEEKEFHTAKAMANRKEQYNTTINDLNAKILETERKLQKKPHEFIEYRLNKLEAELLEYQETNSLKYFEDEFKEQRMNIKDDEIENTYKLQHGQLCVFENIEFYTANISPGICIMAFFNNRVFLLDEPKCQQICKEYPALREHLSNILIFEEVEDTEQYVFGHRKWVKQEDCLKVCRHLRNLPVFMRTVNDMSLSWENTIELSNEWYL